MIIGAPQRTPTTEVYSKLKWSPLEDRWKLNRCVLTYKCINGLVPEYIQNNFINVHSNHNHRTRAAADNKLFVKHNRTSYGQRKFSYQGILDYNSLPNRLRDIDILMVFKRETKCSIFNNFI